MDIGKKLRARRLFKNGRTVIVPMDHPLYFGPISGLEDPAKVVNEVAAGGADAVLISPGIVELVADELKDMAVVLRLDGTHTRLGKHLERVELISSVEEAVRMGVDAVVVNIFVGAENEDVLLAKLGEVAMSCRKHGMLLIGEMIPQPILASHYGKDSKPLSSEQRAEYLALAARLGGEIGVDVVKTHYSGTEESFRLVTSTSTRPIIIAGGVKSGNEKELLQSIHGAIQAGAAGVCIGRNLWQRDNITKMTLAVRAVVHEGASYQEALKII